jgi:hypothetical protein
MTMSNRRELSFDSIGINGPDEYRERVATFTRFGYAEKYGPLFAAAPDLLAALKAYCNNPELSLVMTSDTPGLANEVAVQMRKAIARAEGKEE